MNAHHGLEGSIGLNGNANNGLVVLPKGKFLVNTSWLYWGYTELYARPYSISNVLSMQVANVSQTQLMYGVSTNLTLGIGQAYGWVDYIPLFGDPDYQSVQFEGFNDLNIFGIYRLKREKPWEWGVAFGLEVPTGKASYMTSNVLNTVGSISWDPQLGFVTQRKWTYASLLVQGVFTYNTENKDGYYYGHFYNQNITYEHDLIRKQCCDFLIESESKDSSSFDLSMQTGIQFEWMDKNRKDDSVILNTGGTRVFMTAGLKLQYKDRISLPVQMELPIYEGMNGIQSDTEIRLRFGLNWLI